MFNTWAARKLLHFCTLHKPNGFADPPNHCPSNTSSNRIQTLRITHQRSHLTVEADLPLRHVAGAEPQRVEEAFFSKALASKLLCFLRAIPKQSIFSRKLSPHSCGLIMNKNGRVSRFYLTPGGPHLCVRPLSLRIILYDLDTWTDLCDKCQSKGRA